MSGDNGELKKELTEAELKEAKAKKFNLDPECFIDTDDVVVCVVRTKTGYGTMLGSKVTRRDLLIAKGEVDIMIDKAIMQFEFLREQSKKVIPAPGGFRGNLRNFLGGN